jgi:aminotransferase
MFASERSLKLEASPLKDFFVKAKKLKEKDNSFISLNVGEPNAPITEDIKLAVKEALKGGRINYVPTNGSLYLREKLAEKYGVGPDEIVVSHGAIEILSSLLFCLVDKGDNALIPAPYYPSVVQAVRSLGGNPVFIDTLNSGFVLKAARVEEAVRRVGRVKLLYLNYPNNPTGGFCDRGELEKIMRIAASRRFLVISDECYSAFSPDRNFSMRDIDKNVLAVNSASKIFSMTGFRIGWLVIPDIYKVLRERLLFYLQNFVGSPHYLSEKALFAALDGDYIDDFASQRKIVYDWLEKNGVNHVRFGSGMYAFADFGRFMKGEIRGSVQFAEYIMKEAKVGLVPGVAFGEAYDNYLRISFPVKEDDLREALGRVEQVIKPLR